MTGTADREGGTTAGADAAEDEKRMLLGFLQQQRDAVLSVVQDLPEEAWHTSVVPSGWTPAGFVEHLGGAERHWFQGVLTGDIEELPWDEGLPPYDPNAPFVCERPSADIVAFYRDQCRRSDENLASASMADSPRGTHPDPERHIPNVRWIVLHMIEETATHSGHLEIARELLDGRTKAAGR